MGCIVVIIQDCWYGLTHNLLVRSICKETGLHACSVGYSIVLLWNGVLHGFLVPCLPPIDPPGQKRKRVVRCCTMIWLSGMNKMRRRSSVRACGLLRLVRRCLSSWLIRALRVNALVVCDSAMGLQ